MWLYGMMFAGFGFLVFYALSYGTCQAPLSVAFEQTFGSPYLSGQPNPNNANTLPDTYAPDGAISAASCPSMTLANVYRQVRLLPDAASLLTRSKLRSDCRSSVCSDESAAVVNGAARDDRPAVLSAPPAQHHCRH
jgi:hypothetical protein